MANVLKGAVGSLTGRVEKGYLLVKWQKHYRMNRRLRGHR